MLGYTDPPAQVHRGIGSHPAFERVNASAGCLCFAIVSRPLTPIASCRCANDHTVSFHNVSARRPGLNGQSSTVRYSFDMFRFTTEPHELYLHCTVHLCEPDDHVSCLPVSPSSLLDPSTCMFHITDNVCDPLPVRRMFSFQNCKSISKREAVRAKPPQGLLSYGPIRVEMPHRHQSSKPILPKLSQHLCLV